MTSNGRAGMFWKLCGVFVFAAVVLGCGPSGAPAPAADGGDAGGPKYGGTLKFGWHTEPTSLFPAFICFSWDVLWCSSTSDVLVAYKSDGTPDPANSLAESWKQEDDLTFTFALRKGVKHHDGTAFTAHTMKSNIETIKDPKTGTAFAAQLENIKQVEVLDDYTLRLHLSAPYAPLISNLGERGAVAFSPEAYARAGKEGISEAPSMTGAFKVKEWVPGSHFLVEKTPDYWIKGFPYLDAIRFSIITDDRVRLAALQSKALDMAWWPVAGEATQQLQKEPNLVKTTSTGGPLTLNINSTNPPTDNLKVRQAIASAMDRESFIKTILQGDGIEAKGGVIPPGSWGYADLSATMYKYDLQKAKAYLKDSGLPQPVTLKQTSGTAAGTVLQAEFVKGLMEEAGFKVDLEVTAEPEAFNKRGNLAMGSVATRPDPDGSLSIWMTTYSRRNPSYQTKDPDAIKVSDLIKQAASTYDMEKRKQLTVDAQRIWDQAALGFFPWNYRILTVASQPNVRVPEDFWNLANSYPRPRLAWFQQ